MKHLRTSLVIISLLALAGWLMLRRTASPSNNLNSVSYTAFVSHAPNKVAGTALADAAREWNGVTAATYNVNSGLLVIAHTEAMSDQDLKSRLSVLTSDEPQIKQFDVPDGPVCPVPLEYIEKIPAILLWLFVASSSVYLLLVFQKNSQHGFQ